jgi:hypothetical protein
LERCGERSIANPDTVRVHRITFNALRRFERYTAMARYRPFMTDRPSQQ